MIRFKTTKQMAEDLARSKRRLLAAEAFIASRLPDRKSREIALSLSAVVDEDQWAAPPVYASPKARDRPLLLGLVQPIFVAHFASSVFGGPVKSVSAKQLGAVKFQAKQLASALRDLPPDAQWQLLNSVKFRPASPSKLWSPSKLAEMEEDFLPKLIRLSEAAGRAERGRGIGLTARQMKSAVEDELAFTLALHGVQLEINRKGILAEVLRVGWAHLGINAGSDPFRTLVRLVGKWKPAAVRHEAEQREAEAEQAAEATDSRASGQPVFVFTPALAPRVDPARKLPRARKNDPKR